MPKKSNKPKVVLVGKGYWGNNLERCLRRLGVLTGVVDLKFTEEEMLAEANKLTLTTELDDFLGGGLSVPDGFVIATPPSTHADIAERILEATDAAVLIEKPMTTSVSEAEELQKYGLRIMVDHTFLFVPEFEHIKDTLDRGNLGKPLYAYSDRLNLGKFQDCGVVWDLAPHDLAVFQWLFDTKPEVVSRNIRNTRYTASDVARMDLEYGETSVHLHVSWLHPTKVRTTTIVCEKGMVVYDMLADEKIKIYNPGNGMNLRPTESYGDYLMRYRKGPIVSPYVQQHEPLIAVCEEFLGFIDTGNTRSPFSMGYDVVKTLEEVGG